MEGEKDRDFFGFMMNRPYDGDEETLKENEDQEDSFSRFMFGRGRETEAREEQKLPGALGFLEKVDLDEVLYHVDTLVTSARELKPLFNKVKPYLANFTEKNNS